MVRTLTTRLARTTAAACAAIVVIGAAGPAQASDDEYSERLWGLRKIGAERAWTKGQGQGVTIAIVDSGVDPEHEDLKANLVAGRDFIDGDGDPRDENGHGTHVAGTTAAAANNGIGVAGVAPKAKIMPVRVLGRDGSGPLSGVEDGVRWAVDHGADVVNLSLSSGVVIENASGGTLTDAVNYAWSKGVIPVVSAGNEELFRAELRQAKALIVTATTPDDRQASYATGVGLAQWGIAAPGGTSEGGEANMILSTWWSTRGQGYAYASGTSMAAPHVSGAAAVLRSLGLSAQQVVDRLLSTAKDLGSSGNDLTYGHGRVDVGRAVGATSGAKPSTDGGSSGPPPSAAQQPNRPGSTPPPSTNAPNATKPDARPDPADADPKEKDEPDDFTLAAPEDEEPPKSALPNIIAVSGLAALAAGGWGLSRLKRLRG